MFWRKIEGLVLNMLPSTVGDARDMGLSLGSGRSPGGGNGNPLQHSCLENPMHRGPWRATVHGVTKSQTLLSNWAHTHNFKVTLGVRTEMSNELLQSSRRKLIFRREVWTGNRNVRTVNVQMTIKAMRQEWVWIRSVRIELQVPPLWRCQGDKEKAAKET